MGLKEELKQNKPFQSLEHEAQLNVVRTGAVLMDDVELLLKPLGISPTQFNVLRILRGSPKGLCRNDLRDRMLTRMPDVTRLLDRMEKIGWIERERDLEDRRMVWTRITEKGLQTLARTEEAVEATHRSRFAGFSPVEMQTLIELLTKVRQAQSG
jgi:DNA-binding MarR family transcriptional regulator